MSRWLQALYQPEFKFDKGIYTYLPVVVYKHEFPKSKLLGKDLNDIIPVLKQTINTIVKNSDVNADFDPIEAYSFEEAFSKFTKKHMLDKNAVFEVTLEDTENNTTQTKLVCPLVSKEKSYEISEFDTLISAIAYKLSNED